LSFDIVSAPSVNFFRIKSDKIALHRKMSKTEKLQKWQEPAPD